MKIKETSRGFRCVMRGDQNVIQESSGIGDYDNALDIPGSSLLWIGGGDFQFNREEVQELIEFMQHWLDNHRLPEPKDK